MTTDRTGMEGLYMEINLAACPEELKQMMTEALTLIAART